MNFAGKCPPNKEELELVYSHGFDKVELFLRPDHLDDYQQIIDVCEDATIDVSSIHTPHVDEDVIEYLGKCIDLSRHFDARLVVDSTPVPVSDLVSFELDGKLDYMDVSHGYENPYRKSFEDMERLVLSHGLPLTLDIAHAYLHEASSFRDRFDKYMEHDEWINITHLCDATPDKDHQQIGEGTMPLEYILTSLRDSSEIDYIVLELSPKQQGDSLERVMSIWNSI